MLSRILRRIVPARTAQILVVAPTVRPTAGFVLSALWEDQPRVFFSRRLGHSVCFRPRADLQVAREFLSKYIYDLPREVSEALAPRRPQLRVLDLGANIGMFSLSVVDALGPEIRVDAVEPDADNLALLRRNVDLAGHRDRVAVHPVAVGAHAGSALFVGGSSHSSHLLRPEETSTDAGMEAISVPVMDAFELATGADLIKMDIEGGEWELLRHPRLADLDAAAIALEWHTAGSQSASPEQDAHELLRSAGYSVGYAQAWAGNGFMWAWRSLSDG